MKKRLLLTVLLAMLVQITVFAQENVYLKASIYDAEIVVTGYKGRSPELEGEFYEVEWNSEAANKGEYDKYDKEGFSDLEDSVPYYRFDEYNTGVTSGQTELTINHSEEIEVRVRISPVMGKTKTGVIFLGEGLELSEGDSTILEPGDYVIDFHTRSKWEGLVIEDCGYLRVGDGNSTKAEEVKPTRDSERALATSAKVLVNQKQVDFEAYIINNSNYIKLRDFAYAVTGTKKQFEVSWDAEKSAINLISNKSYSSNGSEFKKGNGKEKLAVLNQSKIYKDEIEVDLTAYTINENNYFKLRDLADAFDIEVTWDGATSTIGIDTSL